MTMQFYLEVLISTGTATFEKAKHKIFNLSRLVNRSIRLNRNHFQPKIKMSQMINAAWLSILRSLVPKVKTPIPITHHSALILSS